MDECAAAKEVADVLPNGVAGALGYTGPSGAGEVALEVVQPEGENFCLTLVDGNVGDAFPEPGPGQGGCHGCVGTVDGLFQVTQESGDPDSGVSPTPLGLLGDAVVGVALPVDLGGQAVEALPGATRADQGHVRDGPGDSAPVWRRLKPPQERVHSTGQQLGGRPSKGDSPSDPWVLRPPARDGYARHRR